MTPTHDLFGLLLALGALGVFGGCGSGAETGSDNSAGSAALGGSGSNAGTGSGGASGGSVPSAGGSAGSGGATSASGGGGAGGAGTSGGAGGGSVAGQGSGSGAGGVGGGGQGGAGGGGAGDLIESVTGTKNRYGFALRDSFYLVPCFAVDGHDCATAMGACPNTSAAHFEERGAVFTEDFSIGGELGKTYRVTIAVNGITEGKYYTGGTRRAGTDYSMANAAAGADGWHVGGMAVESNYNVYKLTVLEPGGTDEVQHYYLNSFPSASGFESHQTVLLGYEATIQVPGGGVVRFTRVDSNCKAINNCGPGDNGNACPAPRRLPNEPNLQLPTMYGGVSVSSMNVVNGAMQPYHSQLIHVVAKKVEVDASP